MKVIRILLDSKGKEAEVVSLQEFSYLVFFLQYAMLNVYRRRKMEKLASWLNGKMEVKGRRISRSPCVTPIDASHR